jgi:hypothetical protein
MSPRGRGRSRRWISGDTTMTRTALASLFSLALAAGAAQASVAGGGDATVSGGGDNMTIAYNTGGAGGGGGALLSQPGRVAHVAGNSDGAQVEYLTAAPAGAGRHAWLVGGGDDTEVVYDRRR